MTSLRQRLQEMPFLRHRSLRAVLPAYLDGSLVDARRTAVAAHLLHCADCRQRVRELQQVDLFLEHLPAAPTVSFIDVWTPIRKRIGAAQAARPGVRRRRQLGLALVIALVASGFGVFAATALDGGRIPIPLLAPGATASGSPSSENGATASGSPPERVGGGGSATSQPRTSVEPEHSASPEAEQSATPEPSPTPEASHHDDQSLSPSASPTESASDSHGGSDVGSPSPSASASH